VFVKKGVDELMFLMYDVVFDEVLCYGWIDG